MVLLHPVLAGVEQRLALFGGEGAQGGVGGVGELCELFAEIGGQPGFAVLLQEGLPVVSPKRRGPL
jgi:hypothetical protein